MSLKRIIKPFIIAIAVMVIAWYTPISRGLIDRMQGQKTVEGRLAEYGDVARNRLMPAFEERGVEYPPKRVVFVALKQENLLQVYAASEDSKLKYITKYKILAASGELGPKLKEGDLQVPEGIYKVTFLNPNSLYHLSLRLNYPNEFDCEMAQKDGRTNLGGDIMIHGDSCSIGCLAMGDPASEDLFVLAADARIENIKVIISPVDFRKTIIKPNSELPKWTGRLYSDISHELKLIPLAAK